ncbi:MAG: hypothetical protein U0353_13240 [Sandaracinus sp.]
MSDLRIAIVAEGPTDLIVIESALKAFLGKPFVATLLQPEMSAAFSPFGSTGGGWGGVYRWCERVVKELGSLGAHQLLFGSYDLLILHIDTDVADQTYKDANITPTSKDLPLPCAKPCPPPSDTADEIRRVALSWVNEPSLPPKTAFCVPATSTETWVLASLFPSDPLVVRGAECAPDAEGHLGRQPKKQRVRKTRRDYDQRRNDLTAAWPRVARLLSQAGRFQADILALP